MHEEWREHVLTLTNCPKCRYDISALPRRHRCPECGFVYDEHMFILEGWRLPGSRRWARVLLVWGPIAAIALFTLRAELGWSLGGLLVSIAAIVTVIGLLYAWVGWRDASGRRVLRRFLITEDGVARPGQHVYLWRNYSHIMLLAEGPDTWRIHLYPSWWRLIVGPPVVSARLEGTDDEAEAVRREIERRMNKARRQDADERQASAPRQRWW